LVGLRQAEVLAKANFIVAVLFGCLSYEALLGTNLAVLQGSIFGIWV
jgi:hypothetical protein